MRRWFPRFQGENFYENMKLVHDVEKIAQRKGVTPGQVALAWVRGKSGKNGLPQILPIPGSSTEDRVKENAKEVDLSEEEIAEIDGILAKFTTKGDRYGAAFAHLMNG
jgi:pyridoxine 4-dehydrogenase